MTDEAFYLTPLDVRRFDFGTQMRGYDKMRVDQFRDQVADELERLTRLNQDLESKAKGFHEQLRAFRERDKALNEALVSAQQLRSEIREQADREAHLILREARAEGDRIVDAAREDIRRLAAEVEMLERTRRSYLAQLRALVERQLHDVDAAIATPPPLPTPIAGAIGSPEPRRDLGRDMGRESGRDVGRDAGRDAGRDDDDSRAGHPTPAWLNTLVNE
jgi:DivIVA domain-containing protein